MTAEEFNETFPVGTLMNYHSPVDGPVTLKSETRTPAWTLSSGYVLVSLKGKAGGVVLYSLSLPDGRKIASRDEQEELER